MANKLKEMNSNVLIDVQDGKNLSILAKYDIIVVTSMLCAVAVEMKISFHI